MPEKLRRAEEAFAQLGRSVTLVATVEDAVRDADLVVDFVPDELESKLEIWSLIDRMAPPKTVMCTPSAMLSITDLASCTYRPDRCVMLRGDLRGGGGEVQLLTAARNVRKNPGRGPTVIRRSAMAGTFGAGPRLADSAEEHAGRESCMIRRRCAASILP